MKSLVLSILLVLYNIALSLLPSRVHALAYVPMNLLATAALLVWSRRAGGISPAGLALTPGYHNVISGMWGMTIGLAIGVPLLVALLILRPYLSPDSLEGFRSSGIADLIFRVVIWIPLGTALLEEIAYRGVLYALLERTSGVNQALVLSSLAFALWHIGLLIRAVTMGSLGRQSALLAFVGISIVTFVAGIGLTFVRVRTSSLIGPMTIHWVVNCLVTLGLWQP